MKNYFFLFLQVYSRKGGGRKTLQRGALRIFISTYNVLDVIRGAGATVVTASAVPKEFNRRKKCF